MERGIGLLGLGVFIALAWTLSENRRAFPWRTVFWGLGLQFIAGVLVLRTSFGAAFFEFLDRAFHKVLSFANEGAAMVFGPLANEALLTEKLGPGNGFVFAVTITATIIVISALSSVLYHYGILQQGVRLMAWVMQRTMRTSGSESLATAANIFLGMTEAPLLIKPYLAGMTRSELLALMVGGMATLAGGVLAAYISFGISASHLLTASVMGAPGALMIAKIMIPESKRSETASAVQRPVERQTCNGLDALCVGACEGLQLAINILAVLIACVAMVALVNYLMSLGLRVCGILEPKPMQWILGWVNAPFAWLMGIPWKDCHGIGSILGERIVLNEFVGYLNLSNAAKSGTAFDPRSVSIATYALCGFANLASVAIQTGGVSVLVPERRMELAQLGMRSMVGGLLSCYCTACIASLLI